LIYILKRITTRTRQTTNKTANTKA